MLLLNITCVATQNEILAKAFDKDFIFRYQLALQIDHMHCVSRLSGCYHLNSEFRCHLSLLKFNTDYSQTYSCEEDTYQ